MAIEEKDGKAGTQVKTIPTWIDNREDNMLLEALRTFMRNSKGLDVATGFFEIGSLLDLDGDCQRRDKIRLLMGDEVTRKAKEAFSEALRAKDQNGIERAQEEDDWKALDGLSAITNAIGTGALEVRVHTRAKSHAKARLS